MNFTGSNLRLLRCAVSLALDEIHNQIATCPDVVEYEGDIAILEQDRIMFEKLLARIDAGIEKEKRHEIHA
jgi:hypothetical protein